MPDAPEPDELDQSGEDQVPPMIEGADGLVQMLATLGNDGVSVSATLFVKGLLVSGMVIGRKQYIEHFVHGLTGGLSEETQAEWKQAFGLNDDEEVTSVAATQRYIHMRDARVYTPGQNPIPENGLHWRGKIVEVDGFALGTFNKPD